MKWDHQADLLLSAGGSSFDFVDDFTLETVESSATAHLEDEEDVLLDNEDEEEEEAVEEEEDVVPQHQQHQQQGPLVDETAAPLLLCPEKAKM